MPTSQLEATAERIPLSEAARKLGTIAREVARDRVPVILTEHGHDLAVLGPLPSDIPERLIPLSQATPKLGTIARRVARTGTSVTLTAFGDALVLIRPLRPRPAEKIDAA